MHLLQREDGSYGNFEGWTWSIQGDSKSASQAWRELIAYSQPSKKVIMSSDVAKKYFDRSLGVLKPEKRLGESLENAGVNGKQGKMNNK